MPRVYLPPAMRSLAGDQEFVDVEGRNVRGVIQALDERYPGVRERLCQGDELRTGVTVIVNGSASALGLLERLEANDEVHFLPAIGGG